MEEGWDGFEVKGEEGDGKKDTSEVDEVKRNEEEEEIVEEEKDGEDEDKREDDR